MVKTLRLNVVTPEREALARDVETVVLPGEAGSFGVLPGHAPLVAALRPGLLRYRAGGETREFAVGGGYAEITGGRVTVLADTAVPAEDIDEDEARQAQAKALAQLRQGVTGPEQEAADVALRKALSQLQVAGLRRRRRGG